MKRLILFVLLSLSTLSVGAQEKVVLTTPVLVSVGASDFRVWDVYFRRTHPDRLAEIRITFREVNGTAFVAGGRSLDCHYEGDVADALIVTLNKINLATTSLEKRITQRCQMDGGLGAGSITGSPQ